MKLLIGDGDIVLGCNQKKKENIPAYFSTSKCYTKYFQIKSSSPSKTQQSTECDYLLEVEF